ncbi:hypothetical protein CKO25_01435 [Thiocapsa imhoffii]|uniref:Zinc-dependent peptidase n=1 Tax=Thiocapsa imhoffii TaxID=382777 RepID=A0A9X1B764_9GAMM|nr:M90 family metallopeptidase [Thiocapsa imhoffii]MBK1643337.1 hypothetical protein [Thiocapsa imhoffii]
MRGLINWWQGRVLAHERARIAPHNWEQVWEALPLLADLTEAESRRLADLALLFLREKRIDPAQGLELTDPMRLAIALQACLPILELGLDWFTGWYAVILYPEEFVPEREVVGDDGVVWIEHEAKSGEAWEQGPVILSWADVAASCERDGYNVVIHEFVHKLDLRDGAANGCPPLHPEMSPRQWTDTFAAAYQDLCDRVDAGDATPFDSYATESPAEFFAVISESFFEVPKRLHAEYPGVYEQLRAFYRQDPLARMRATRPSARMSLPGWSR